MKTIIISLLTAMLLSIPAGAAAADRIEDNSFLIEEAYNQEPGVVQHIFTYQYLEDETWAASFTQEWPAPNRTHQLSYTIVYSGDNGPGGLAGFGDALINYRLQLVDNETVAFAPRLSLALPTGDEDRGFGNDVFGYQINLPLSVVLSDAFVAHGNLGATWMPHATGANEEDADLTSFNYGGSMIWLVSPKFNLMVESVGMSSESFGSLGMVEREDSFFISPGLRFAIDFDSGLQVVPGIAAPIGVGPSKDEYGVFAYLSLEHPFTAAGR